MSNVVFLKNVKDLKNEQTTMKSYLDLLENRDKYPNVDLLPQKNKQRLQHQLSLYHLSKNAEVIYPKWNTSTSDLSFYQLFLLNIKSLNGYKIANVIGVVILVLLITTNGFLPGLCTTIKSIGIIKSFLEIGSYLLAGYLGLKTFFLTNIHIHYHENDHLLSPIFSSGLYCMIFVILATNLGALNHICH